LSTQDKTADRSRIWFTALAGSAETDTSTAAHYPASVLVADTMLQNERVRYLAVVPDPQNRFPRAHQGEVGIDECWALAHAVHAAFTQDHDGDRRALIALVGLPSQAYGRREEQLGLHLACAAATDAYASARLAGHPVIALIVGHAQSGGFLAHGYQANRLLALDDPEVSVHAMGKEAAARVTRRSVEEIEQIAQKVLPMAYTIRDYARLGILDTLIEGVQADDPEAADIQRVKDAIVAAIIDARSGPRDLSRRWTSPSARVNRAASISVRERMATQWR
jgi:biotin-independent malonate decarboxylase gamma subunit